MVGVVVALSCPLPPKGNSVSEDYPPLFERTEIDGLKVVTDEVYQSGLSGYYGKIIPIRGLRKLTLEDDSVVIGCYDCEFAGTLGQTRQHRNQDHGVSVGRTRRKSAADAEAAGDTTPAVSIPQDSLSMTVHELLDLAAHVDQWETVLTQLEEKVEQLTEDLAEERKARRAAEREMVSLRRKIVKTLGLELTEGSE